MATTTINLNGVQEELVSGTNIKTVNGSTLLGAGDVVTPNMANTNLTLTAGRTHTLGTNTITLNGTSGGLNVNTTTGVAVTAQSVDQNAINGISTNNYGGTFQGQSGSLSQGAAYGGVCLGNTGAGIYAYSTGAGWGGIMLEQGTSAGALNAQGRTLINGTAVGQSALLQVDSTTQGVLLPRMTTTQRDAIASPATGLKIFNTTTVREEYYNGTYWQGETKFVQVGHSGFNPGDAQFPQFGSMPIPSIAAGGFGSAYDITLRGSGVIRGCSFTAFSGGSAGTAEAWSLTLLFNGVSYLVATASM